MLKPAAFALLLALASCSSPGPKISAHDAWARESGTAGSTAAYLTVENKGAADELVGVRSSLGMAMLHESSMDGGIMRMRPVDPKIGLTVPSNGKLLLAPGASHIMVTGLKRPLQSGDTFTLTLIFHKSKPQHFSVSVRPAAQ